MENYHLHDKGKVVCGNIWNGYGKDCRSNGHFTWNYETDADGWCRYGVEWTPDGYTYYANGKRVLESKEAVSHTEQFILVSTEPGGYRMCGNDGGLTAGRRTWGKPDPGLFEAILPDYFEVDYVRVFDEA